MEIPINELMEKIKDNSMNILKYPLYEQFFKEVVRVIGIRFFICYIITNTLFFIVTIMLLKQ